MQTGAFSLCQEYVHIAEIDTTCAVDRATSIVVDCIVSFALLYFAITYALLFAKLRGYRKLPYSSAQVGLVYNTLQVNV